MISRILAFRTARVVQRLPPRSGACPLSARELLGAAVELGLVLPMVRAPIAGVARGALVAAKELKAALGLALPAGVPPEPWFDGVARAADEVASGLPLFLSADVAVESESGPQVARACREAWRLVDAGLTHLAIDVAAVAAPERGRILGEVAQVGAEHGASVEAVVPLGEGPQGPARAMAMLEEVARRGVPVDAAGVRCPPPADDDQARLQAAALARMSQALAGVPILRRGPVTPRLLELLRGSPVKACEDGGMAAGRALGVLTPERAAPVEGGERARTSALERAARELPPEVADRLEAGAYADAADFMERLGARGSALTLSRALEIRLEER